MQARNAVEDNFLEEIYYLLDYGIRNGDKDLIAKAHSHLREKLDTVNFRSKETKIGIVYNNNTTGARYLNT